MRVTPAADRRVVHCEDAIAWMNLQTRVAGTSLVTSIPDISEFKSFTLEQWKDWFMRTVALCLSHCDDNGVGIFYQSDIEVDGVWIDKAYLCQKVAELSGHALLWHRITCRAPAGTATLGRASYSHILCFSKNLRRSKTHGSGIDVIPHDGEKTWTSGMGLRSCLQIAKFLRDAVGVNQPEFRVLNPFCGEGALLATVNALGMKGVGIERSAKRAETARLQELKSSAVVSSGDFSDSDKDLFFAVSES